ncbi:hypothetical protein PQX77_021749 [Marasmius sp. AFHP31]|nr:hypothetical protein PQX77_021749 [Marasmius sp. AFHP31]
MNMNQTKLMNVTMDLDNDTDMDTTAVGISVNTGMAGRLMMYSRQFGEIPSATGEKTRYLAIAGQSTEAHNEKDIQSSNDLPARTVVFPTSHPERVGEDAPSPAGTPTILMEVE